MIFLEATYTIITAAHASLVHRLIPIHRDVITRILGTNYCENIQIKDPSTDKLIGGSDCTDGFCYVSNKKSCFLGGLI